MSAVVLRVADILAVDLSSSTGEIVPTPEDVDVVEVASFEEVAAFEPKSALGLAVSDADIRSTYRTVTPGSFLTQSNGILAGTGGFTLVGRSRGCEVQP